MPKITLSVIGMVKDETGWKTAGEIITVDSEEEATRLVELGAAELCEVSPEEEVTEESPTAPRRAKRR